MKKSDIKNNSISIRCSLDEKSQITKYAKKSGMTISEYIIQKSIFSQIEFDYCSPLNYIKTIYNMQNLTNKFKEQRISRKDYAKNMEKEMQKLWP
jgi:hypothetical protein